MDKLDSLRKRGQFSVEDVRELVDCSKQELLEHLNSDNAVKRSAAAHILGAQHTLDPETVRLLLENLTKEKALYTRLEICSVLEAGNLQTARIMAEYLGKIGNNQYSVLPERGSHKISYPLARDLIARSLGRMKPEIYQALVEVLQSDDVAKISEACDAAGYLIFYNQQLATDNNAQFFCSLVDKYQANELVMWKTLTCLSAFSQTFVQSKLEEIIKQKHSEIIYKEAERSLKLIKRRELH